MRPTLLLVQTAGGFMFPKNAYGGVDWKRTVRCMFCLLGILLLYQLSVRK